MFGVVHCSTGKKNGPCFFEDHDIGFWDEARTELLHPCRFSAIEFVGDISIQPAVENKDAELYWQYYYRDLCRATSRSDYEYCSRVGRIPDHVSTVLG